MPNTRSRETTDSSFDEDNSEFIFGESCRPKLALLPDGTVIVFTREPVPHPVFLGPNRQVPGKDTLHRLGAMIPRRHHRRIDDRDHVRANRRQICLARNPERRPERKRINQQRKCCDSGPEGSARPYSFEHGSILLQWAESGNAKSSQAHDWDMCM